MESVPKAQASDWLASHKIIALTLDEAHFKKRTKEIEHERAVALGDLLDMNRFKPLTLSAELSEEKRNGPYKVNLGIRENKRLQFDIYDEIEALLTTISLPLTPFRSIIKDYFQICESYYGAVIKLTPAQIETIDMARRGLHNEGADILREVLKDKILIDKATSRRLFTLICVLHI